MVGRRGGLVGGIEVVTTHAFIYTRLFIVEVAFGEATSPKIYRLIFPFKSPFILAVRIHDCAVEGAFAGETILSENLTRSHLNIQA